MEKSGERKRKSKRRDGHKKGSNPASLELSKRMLKKQLRVPGMGLASTLIGSGSGGGRSSRIFSLFFAFMVMVFVRITPKQMGMRMNAEADGFMPMEVQLQTKMKMEMMGADVPKPKILGGTVAPEGRYRFIVNLVAVSADYRYRFCGGVLVQPDVVLTAAHCVWFFKRKPWRLRVQTGRFDISEEKEKGSEQFTAEEIIIHPQWTTDGDNDFALVRLSGKSSSPTIKVANGFSIKDGEFCTALGWGGIDLRATQAIRLRQLELKTVHQKSCQATHHLSKMIVYDSNLCAVPREGHISENNVYYGDSGGPLIVQRNGEDVVVGLASRIFPVQQYNGGFPSLFAKVSSVYSWIKSEAKL